MLERQIVVPADADRLWEVLTSPDEVGGWFGADVAWDLRPGGLARFEGAEGVRHGRVDEVEPGRHLRFRWWPEGDEGSASEVAYVLAPDEGGTRLTVTERPASAGADAVTASACVASTGRAAGWTSWDGRLAGIWGLVVIPRPVAVG